MEEGFILVYGSKGNQSSWEGMVAGECHTARPVWKERTEKVPGDKTSGPTSMTHFLSRLSTF